MGAIDGISYYLYETLSGAFIEELPFRGVTFSVGPVNQYGTFSGSLDIQDPGLAKTDWRHSTAPTYATLVVDYNGEPVFGGVISGRKETFGPNGFQLEIDAQEGWAWWQQVVQATDYSSPPYSGITGIGPGSAPYYATMPYWNYTGAILGIGTTPMPGYPDQPFIWDPMLIGAQIIADAIAVPNQNVWGGVEILLNGYLSNSDFGAAYRANLTPPYSGSIPTPEASFISINFPYTSLQTVGAMLTQLTSLGYGVGFDGILRFRYQTDGNPTSGLKAQAVLSYPRQGLIGGTNANGYLDLTHATMWEFPEDGTTQAATVYETGGNQDIVVVQNVFPTEEGYPNTARVMNIANLNSPNPTALLQEMGTSDLVLYSWPPVAPQITVDLNDTEAGIGTIFLGDDIYVNIPKYAQDGDTFDPRFPEGLNGVTTLWRIVSYAATVADQGQSTLMLTLDTPPPASTVRSSSTLGPV